MTIYVITVICTILISSAVIFLIMYRSRLLDFKTLVFIMIASMISAVVLPAIYNAVFSYAGGDLELSTVAVLIAAVFAIFTVVVFILSLMVSRIAPRFGAASGKRGSLEAEPAAAASSEEGNYLEQIFTSFIGRNNDESGDMPSNNDETADMGINILEKSVDSEENIDKMGIENITDRDSITIEECIEEAFRLKESGDFEGAILYYMYALDKEPSKELTFWIILDICVLYKSLGQLEMAIEILNNYYMLGDIIDEYSKEEIEGNLTGMRA
ncbi:MAG: hypothetical protein ACM3XR_08315 [Bacillota bacterium]